MLRVVPLLLCALLTACQSTPRGEQDERFYNYVDAQGNLITVQTGDRTEDSAVTGEQPDSGESAPNRSKTSGSERDSEAGQEEVNKDFMSVRPEQYQTTGQAQERMEQAVEEDESDRFISYRGPTGEIISRPLNLAAERKAAEEKQEQRAPRFEQLPDQQRYKEGTSRVPADCCRHLIEAAPVLEAGSNNTLRFRPDRTVRLDRDRPARALRLAPGLGAVQVESFLRDQGYLAPRLLMLDQSGMPVLKVDSLFTRHYPETWARHGYMDGRVDRSPRFAYAVFYLPYARVGDQGLELDPGAEQSQGEFRRALTGELAVTGRVQTTRGRNGE